MDGCEQADRFMHLAASMMPPVSRALARGNAYGLLEAYDRLHALGHAARLPEPRAFALRALVELCEGFE